MVEFILAGFAVLAAVAAGASLVGWVACWVIWTFTGHSKCRYCGQDCFNDGQLCWRHRKLESGRRKMEQERRRETEARVQEIWQQVQAESAERRRRLGID